MTIFNEVFDSCYNVLAGTFSNVRDASERRRYNRALLALRSQNFFLSVTFENITGAAGVTDVQRTLAFERPLIIRGAGMNTYFFGDGTHFEVPTGGAVNVKLTRSQYSKPQINRGRLRSAHYFSQGEGQKWSLDWPCPWVLEPNEIILSEFEQISAVNPNTLYNLAFYGVTVDPAIRCDQWMLDDIRRQILNEPIQKPRYIHLKTDNGAGTINLPAIGNNQRAVANTIEMPEHMLVLGWRRYMVGWGPDSGVPGPTTVKLTVTGGRSFSRVEIPANAMENFNTPDAGWFRFSIPHFVPKGSSLSLSITTDIQTALYQFDGEIELLCVTV